MVKGCGHAWTLSASGSDSRSSPTPRWNSPSRLARRGVPRFRCASRSVLEAERVCGLRELKDALHLVGTAAKRELVAARAGALPCPEQGLQAGAVHEAEPRQIDDHPRGVLGLGREQLAFEVGRRGEIELAVQDHEDDGAL